MSRLAYHVLVDSDAFVGRFFSSDAHYKRVKRIFQELKDEKARLVTTNLVVYETATVLSTRSGQTEARRFLVDFVGKGKIDVVDIDRRFQDETVELFVNQDRRATSIVDCSNVIVMRRLHIPRIFSFDRAYPRQYNVDPVA